MINIVIIKSKRVINYLCRHVPVPKPKPPPLPPLQKPMVTISPPVEKIVTVKEKETKKTEKEISMEKKKRK